MDKAGRIRVLEAQVGVLTKVNQDLVRQVDALVTAVSDRVVGLQASRAVSVVCVFVLT